MTSSVIRAVLFDLDGTLLDTAPDLVGSLNHVRATEDLPPLPVDDYRRFVSQGALGLINGGMPAADDDVTQDRIQRFLAHYAVNSCVDTRPFDGVEQLLLDLESQAIPWAIVTNKAEYLTLPIVEHLGWANRPAAVICGDTLAQRKPHPAPVRLACELSGVEPGQAIMVGDDPRDLEAAEAAGAIPVLVAYGYGAGEILRSGRYDGVVVDTAGQLLGLVNGSDGPVHA